MKTEEQNEFGHIKTPFDGRFALMGGLQSLLEDILTPVRQHSVWAWIKLIHLRVGGCTSQALMVISTSWTPKI